MLIIFLCHSSSLLSCTFALKRPKTTKLIINLSTNFFLFLCLFLFNLHSNVLLFLGINPSLYNASFFLFVFLYLLRCKLHCLFISSSSSSSVLSYNQLVVLLLKYIIAPLAPDVVILGFCFTFQSICAKSRSEKNIYVFAQSCVFSYTS